MDRDFANELKQADDGVLWEAIVKYTSNEISVLALKNFSDVIMGMANYNIPKLLDLWDAYHDYAVSEKMKDDED